MTNANSRNGKKPATVNSKNNNNLARRISFIFILILIVLGIASLMTPTTNLEEVPISDVIARANDENGDIAKISVAGNNLNITLKGKDIA
ncbi:hypothetical protein IJJ18_00680, partial [Candidatus Saccharibacteria bacterium]|nr:hypothetical protein [Candidatus Saccharibacteria bacterium]